ncbi:zinc finger protein 729 isoform X3 [Pieris rapae]|uniref:zinc finger protein 729 isoform X3 n=1 Tax=Pieris rapae TaxID=64459 RepID=UPI001E27EB79|nr:zinc finger protein 729 isoform X3 [Pieris rapae]
MEFDDVIVKENPGLCRCCLSEGCYKELATEYLWMGENEVYADMLLECFDISISQNNEGPNGTNRLICEVCITRLRDACNFKKQVLECEKKFVDMVGRGDFKQRVTVDILFEDNLKLEQNTEEQLQDTGNFDFLEEPMAFDDEINDDVTAEPLPVKGKRGRPKKSIKSVKKKEEKPKASKAKDENPEGLEPYTSEKRRKNLQILFNNTTIIPFKWRGKYLCFYCANDYTDYLDLKEHMKSHGQCTTRDYSLRAIKGNSIEIKLDISAIECLICSEPFTSRSEIVDHLIGKHDLDYDKTIETPISEFRLVDMKCQYCEKDFSYFVYLRRHLKLAHSHNSFVCDDCGATFNTKRDLAFHLHNFHKYGGYPCDVCADVFDSKSAWKSHKNKNHFRKCIYCNISFASFSLLQKHIQNEHSQFKSNKCPYCAKKCHSKQGVGLHIKNCKMNMLQKTPAMLPSENAIEPKKKQNLTQIRRNIINVLNMTSVVPFKFFGKFSCFYCSIRFTEFEDLKQHTASEHPFCDLDTPSIKKCKGERTTVKIDISSLACRICSEPVEEFDQLIDHIIAKHSASYDKSVHSFEPFRIYIDKCSCTHCSSVFRYFTTLLRHCNSEHSDTCHVCDSCGRSFKKVSNLTAHIAHTHKGACECAICGIQYRNQWCLNRHNAKCHNAKDFKCPNCPEQFQSPYQRQKHLIKVHDIGHKCSYCGRMFTRNSFMRDHIRRTHLKEKNMECSICGEKFFDNHLLKLHMVKHEGVRKFSCAVCCKSFMRRSNLASHMGMHKKYGHVNAE